MTVDPVDPGDKKSFKLDYSVLLAQLGPSAKIVTSSWELHPDLQQLAVGFDNTTTAIKIDFANASIGSNYTCYNHIETDGGDARRRAMIVPVRDSATFSQASNLKETLEAIRAAIAKNATRAQLRRTIGDKAIEWMSIDELLKAETRYQQLYNQEKRNERTRAGEPFVKNIHARFI